MSDYDKVLGNCPLWSSAYAIQRDTLREFHDRCANVLGEACELRPMDEQILLTQRNLFSTLFIASALSLGLSETKVRFYSQIYQCIRSLVTGCDNILDDEYKEVIPFDDRDVVRCLLKEVA